MRKRLKEFNSILAIIKPQFAGVRTACSARLEFKLQLALFQQAKA